MDSISLSRSDPKAFILAADGDFSDFDAARDQVWSLNLCGTPSSPFSLTTTYGLTAKSVNLFPNICINNQRLTESTPYAQPPTVTRYTPASLRVNLKLQTDLDLQFDCYMPEPDVLMGAVQVKNTGSDIAELSLEMAFILIPMLPGTPSHPDADGITQIITAQAGNFYPVLYMTGGPSAISNPYPSLSKLIQIPPQKTKSLSWALVSKATKAQSIKTARDGMRKNWRKSVQTHVMAHTHQTIHIKTGNPDWDDAFFLAQTNAMTHWVSPNNGQLPSFMIRDRNPDHNIHPEQTHQSLDDLTVLEAHHLAQIWLPARKEKLKSLVENFLTRIDQDGCLPVRLNASPFKPPIAECPLLASLCLAIYEIDRDTDFLQRVFPLLRRISDRWFRTNTHSESGIPLVWESPEQLQISSGLFKFDIWEATGSGLDIKFAESPALAAMLQQEAGALGKLAKILQQPSIEKRYERLTSKLDKITGDFWQEKHQGFVYRDPRSHTTPSQEVFMAGPVQKNIKIEKQFTAAQRLQILLISNEEGTRAGRIQFAGKSPSGEQILETFAFRDICWVLGRAHITTHQLYGSLEAIHVEGLKPQDRFLLQTVDFSQQDVTCLLPLWSGEREQTQLEELLEKPLNAESPDLRYGIPETWRCTHNLPEKLPLRVNVLWNTLIIEGLARSGLSNEASKLFTNLMNSVTRGLKHFTGFYPYFDQETGCPCGQRNAIAGLPPLRLFLQIAGIRLLSPTKVALWGENPFPWPLEVQWQGLSLKKEGSHTRLTFPDGSVYHHNSMDSVLLTQSEKQA